MCLGLRCVINLKLSTWCSKKKEKEKLTQRVRPQRWKAEQLYEHQMCKEVLFVSFFNNPLQIGSEIYQWKMNEEALWIKCCVIKIKLCFTFTLISGAESQCEENCNSVICPWWAYVKFSNLELKKNSGHLAQPSQFNTMEIVGQSFYMTCLRYII